MSEAVHYKTSLLHEEDLHFFNEGTHSQLYRRFGAHPAEVDGVKGCFFLVWAPNADRLSVIGDFNDWEPGRHPLILRGESGVWEGFIPGIELEARYKYHLACLQNGYSVAKADPFAFRSEPSPGTASVVYESSHQWGDQVWMKERKSWEAHKAPISIYEVHLGSWMRVPEEGNRSLNYRELAERLGSYLKEVGYTHVELLPITEHPYYPSWGYQTTGYFSATSRYGSPDDFSYLIDHLHQEGIGVILDWVPSHFPSDEHGLGFFDGTHLYEHADPRQGYHPDWNSLIFNYSRHEVRSFLISSALFWLDRYHIDGIRVDAVASMLYLDYSRADGEWVPNPYGGRENIDAVEFIKQLNQAIKSNFPDVFTIAEESTSWPLISRPTEFGGLGFDFKWDMGWMHDTLKYIEREPIYRSFHHNELTFRGMYQFSENFVLPLSHDEVVHLKGSLIRKMPGDDWQRFANLRLLLCNMWTQPGKKLLFMGMDIAQWSEWNHDSSVSWHLLERPLHYGVQRSLLVLNQIYRREAALHASDCLPGGFSWIDPNNYQESVISFLRREDEEILLIVLNYTPSLRNDYCLGAPKAGRWREIFNSDAQEYGGSGVGNEGEVWAKEGRCHNQPYTLNLKLPPLGGLIFKWEPTYTPDPLQL